jgi:septal ring factor EnvC (AmiA/AmiB activator)
VLNFRDLTLKIYQPINPKIMNILVRKISIVFSLAVLSSSCVSNKQYADLLKDKDRLDVNVERSHKEIRELKEEKSTLQDQIKAKNVEITKLEQQVNTFKRQSEEIGAKFNMLDDQMKKMTTDLEAKKSESASLIASYEQKITELQLANAAMLSRKTSTPRKSSKVRKSKVALPAALKI